MTLDHSAGSLADDVSALPRMSVVLSTRNRADDAVSCVQSILANEGFDELVVVDQSDSNATERALSVFDDSRLQYVASSTRGVTTSRNVGAASTLR